MAFREELTAGIVWLETFTVATAPDATQYTGAIIYVSNGAAGSPCIAFSNGTNWIRTDDSSTAIAAS